ncbi:hypothetical protein AB0J01_41400 [Streptomyces sp. NPDC050204]|uniref:hypothetical protein n=1 Tax=Streptomyces sp. NPDC050204 TaxID=3155514 RepID=UPI003422B696
MTDAIGAPRSGRTPTINDSASKAIRSDVHADNPVVNKARPARPALPGRLLVEYFSDLGPVSRRLDVVPLGTLVGVAGTVTALSQTGTDEAPRALFTVTGMTGESAQCTVDTEHYLDLWDFLVEGVQIRVSGRVRRPMANEPGYIEILAIQAAPAAAGTAKVVGA